MQALVVTTAGGLAMLAGLVALSVTAGTTSLSGIIAQAPELVDRPGPLVPVSVVLVLLGALTKSAIVPFHFWLPAAMAAPTPVSAYLHAAAMVKAGIYLVARLAPAFALMTGWRETVTVLGWPHARRRVPRAPADRPQAPARLRHRRAARLPRARRGWGAPPWRWAGVALLVAHTPRSSRRSSWSWVDRPRHRHP